MREVRLAHSVILLDLFGAQDELIDFQPPEEIGKIAAGEVVWIFFKVLKLEALIINGSFKAGFETIYRIYSL
jgi:hypothetical protein